VKRLDKSKCASGASKLVLCLLVLHFNPWVEASAGGLLVPEGLYSPVAKYLGTCFQIRI
jgi:hypothetical protein